MTAYSRGAHERIRQSDLFKEGQDAEVRALQKRLEKIVDMVLSSRRSVRPAAEELLPQDYTRMDAAIRHLTKLLSEVEARTKLLIALSDGRPDDQDGYRRPYGMEDTRAALMETRYLGIHPYCTTIDEEALDYLPQRYGPGNFTAVDQIQKLPFTVSDIYRRITL